MNSVVLPPLDCTEALPSLADRLLSGAVVVALHLLVIYAALYLSVKNDLIQIPESISVRLLPMIEEKIAEPTKPLPPPPKPLPKIQRQPPKERPVLAVASTTSASAAFIVAPPPPASPPAPIHVAVAPSPPVAIVAARFDADYLHNPKPVYPTLSRRNGEEGKVLLKVRVSPQGDAQAVQVSRSSGFPRLDAAATDTVSRWRFVPARRGDEPIESTVLVPITFAFD